MRNVAEVARLPLASDFCPLTSDFHPAPDGARLAGTLPFVGVVQFEKNVPTGLDFYTQSQYT